MDAEERGRIDLLRHTVATLAYRGGKALGGAPAGFATFRSAEGTRTPAQILAHINDLFDWAIEMADGRHVWHDSLPQEWDAGVARFFAGLARLDARLAGGQPLGVPAGTLFQGPIADALTHIGQIALLRRMAGAPVRGENYARADIVTGRVGPEQSAPRREFE